MRVWEAVDRSQPICTTANVRKPIRGILSSWHIELGGISTRGHIELATGLRGWQQCAFAIRGFSESEHAHSYLGVGARLASSPPTHTSHAMGGMGGRLWGWRWQEGRNTIGRTRAPGMASAWTKVGLGTW